MQNVIESIHKKQEQFEKMQLAMTSAVNKNLHSNKKVKMERQFEEHKTENATIQLGDCVQLIEKVPENSI